jgi:FAD/FMN-containing dehydrogenase
MTFTRREFIGICAGATLATGARLPRMLAADEAGIWVNDVHSMLNRTRVQQIVRPDSLKSLQSAIQSARHDGKAVCVAGGRHAMGAQQFATDATLLDTTSLTRILRLEEKNLVEVEAGIQWPELLRGLHKLQEEAAEQYSIAQKPTGTDRLTIGGALAANIHGRGLRMKPMIVDVEAFTLVDCEGELRRCNRAENPDLFRLVIGGYGLFGIVYSIHLRLVPRQKVRREVRIIRLNELMAAFERRIADGYLYGDFQFDIDENSAEFMQRGVFSCYAPVDTSVPLTAEPKEISDDAWRELLYLAHSDKSEGFRRYSQHYLATDGQVYWSDSQQLSTYLNEYHGPLDARLGGGPATEIITEIYVPRPKLETFMQDARDDFRKHRVNLIYGTIRLIEKDDESFLAWAKQSYACIIFNLHTLHTAEGLEHSARAFRKLIELAIDHGGSYYLTYHKYATRQQVLTCYPQFPEFLRLKLKHDPQERFQSDWYRHYKSMFAA